MNIYKNKQLLKSVFIFTVFWFFIFCLYSPSKNIQLILNWLYPFIYIVPISFALGILIYFYVFFHNDKEVKKRMQGGIKNGIYSAIIQPLDLTKKIHSVYDEININDMYEYLTNTPEGYQPLNLKKYLRKDEDFKSAFFQDFENFFNENDYYTKLYQKILQILFAYPEYYATLYYENPPRNHGKRSLIQHSILVSWLMIRMSENFNFIKWYQENSNNTKYFNYELNIKNKDFVFNSNQRIIPILGLAHDLGKINCYYMEKENKKFIMKGNDKNHAQESIAILSKLDEYWNLTYVPNDKNEINNNDLHFIVNYVIGFYHKPAQAPLKKIKVINYNNEQEIDNFYYEHQDYEEKYLSLLWLLILADKEAGCVENNTYLKKDVIIEEAANKKIKTITNDVNKENLEIKINLLSDEDYLFKLLDLNMLNILFDANYLDGSLGYKTYSPLHKGCVFEYSLLRFIDKFNAITQFDLSKINEINNNDGYITLIKNKFNINNLKLSNYSCLILNFCLEHRILGDKVKIIILDNNQFNLYDVFSKKIDLINNFKLNHDLFKMVCPKNKVQEKIESIENQLYADLFLLYDESDLKLHQDLLSNNLFKKDLISRDDFIADDFIFNFYVNPLLSNTSPALGRAFNALKSESVFDEDDKAKIKLKIKELEKLFVDFLNSKESGRHEFELNTKEKIILLHNGLITLNQIFKELSHKKIIILNKIKKSILVQENNGKLIIMVDDNQPELKFVLDELQKIGINLLPEYKSNTSFNLIFNMHY